MNIRKIIGMDDGVFGYQIEVTPKVIALPKNTKSFILYLQKGMQVIGKFQGDNTQNFKDLSYRFRNIFPTFFRIGNLSNSSYNWTLYSINPQNFQQIFQDSATFNIERTIKLYQTQLNQKQRQIQTSFKFKTVDKNMILELWANAKKQMKTYRSIQKCMTINHGLQIQFQIEIKNIIDNELQKYQLEGQRKKMRRVRSDDYTSISSQGRNKTSSPSEIKDKINQPSTISMFNPYTIKFPLADHVNQGQNLQIQPPSDKLQQQSTTEVFNTTVKIVSPNGEEIQLKQNEENQRRNQFQNSSNASSRQPAKKFSLLSDIIQVSFQGSSSYGRPEHSSNGFKTEAYRKNGTIMDMINENQPSQKQKPTKPYLNKFKTLPDENHSIDKQNNYRRALTSNKQHSDISASQIKEQSFRIQKSNVFSIEQKPTSGDPYGKWIILTALIIIVLITGGTIINQSPQKVKRSKNKNY